MVKIEGDREEVMPNLFVLERRHGFGLFNNSPSIAQVT
jgi:hypothetical protein